MPLASFGIRCRCSGGKLAGSASVAEPWAGVQNLAEPAAGRKYAVKRGGHQKSPCHIDQPGDGADGVVGVQRGQHQMSGQRRIDSDVGGSRSRISPDEDDIRSGGRGTQPGGK